jgi:hypothetical protein
MISTLHNMTKTSLAIVASALVPLCVVKASAPSLTNPGLDSNESKVPAWSLNNAAPVFTDDGKTAVRLPSLRPKKYAKVYQRLPIDGETVEAVRLGATVRCIPNAALHTGSKPSLRFLYFPKDTNWKFSDAIWPDSSKGARTEIQFHDGWQKVWFELECPEDARFIEVLVECENPEFWLEVDEFTLELKPRP